MNERGGNYVNVDIRTGSRSGLTACFQPDRPAARIDSVDADTRQDAATTTRTATPARHARPQTGSIAGVAVSQRDRHTQDHRECARASIHAPSTGFTPPPAGLLNGSSETERLHRLAVLSSRLGARKNRRTRAESDRGRRYKQIRSADNHLWLSSAIADSRHFCR